MKLLGGMPRGEFITRAQPAEKEDGNVDQPNQKKGKAESGERSAGEGEKERVREIERDGGREQISLARVCSTQSWLATTNQNARAPYISLPLFSVSLFACRRRCLCLCLYIYRPCSVRTRLAIAASFLSGCADVTREHFQLAAFRFGGWRSPGFNQPITQYMELYGTYLLVNIARTPNAACRTAARNKSI